MVVDLLVNGADPATTPVVILAHEAATINTETCEAIGLSLDDVKAAFATLGIGVVENYHRPELQLSPFCKTSGLGTPPSAASPVPP